MEALPPMSPLHPLHPLDPVGPLDPLERLCAAQEEVNPALLMAWRVKSLEFQGKLNMPALIAMAGEIDDARVAGAALVEATDSAFSQLTSSTPQASPDVPPGF